MTTFDTLATDYDAGRIGYTNELYDTLIAYGVQPADQILADFGLHAAVDVSGRAELTERGIEFPPTPASGSRRPWARPK